MPAICQKIKNDQQPFEQVKIQLGRELKNKIAEKTKTKKTHSWQRLKITQLETSALERFKKRWSNNF